MLVHLKKSVLLLFLSLLTCANSDESVMNEVHLAVYRTGNDKDIITQTKPAVVLMGGADANTSAERIAFEYLVNCSGGGDVVVLRSSGSDGYNDFIYSTISGVNSVTTLVVDSREKAESMEVDDYLERAEMVFLAGGDQSKYVAFWKGTQLNNTLNRLINEKNIPIGGTSAGLAILGEYYYGATDGSATAAELLSNPYHLNANGIEGNDFLDIDVLNQVITDSHYAERERQARHFAFLARLIKDFNVPAPRGIGVDEATAVLIDENGIATVHGDGKAYFLKAGGTTPEQCEPGKPLTWLQEGQAVEVFQLEGGTELTFDVKQWEGPEALKSYWYAEDGVFAMD